MAVLGLRFCARAFSSCGKRGPLFIVVRGPLTIAASPVAEHRLQTRRLSNCGSRAQLLRGMWDLPRPGLEPVSPALAGRFSTTVPPGKALFLVFLGTSILFPIVAVSIYIPTNSARGFLFSTPSPAFVVCRFSDDAHSNRCEVIPHCRFDLHFSKN